MGIQKDTVLTPPEWAVDALLADGFESAFIGWGTQFSRAVAIYDYAKCVQILVTRDGMSPEDAMEFIEFNVTGSYCGDNTPVFLRREDPV